MKINAKQAQRIATIATQGSVEWIDVIDTGGTERVESDHWVTVLVVGYKYGAPNWIEVVDARVSMRTAIDFGR